MKGGAEPSCAVRKPVNGARPVVMCKEAAGTDDKSYYWEADLPAVIIMIVALL